LPQPCRKPAAKASGESARNDIAVHIGIIADVFRQSEVAFETDTLAARQTLFNDLTPGLLAGEHIVEISGRKTCCRPAVKISERSRTKAFMPRKMATLVKDFAKNSANWVRLAPLLIRPEKVSL